MILLAKHDKFLGRAAPAPVAARPPPPGPGRPGPPPVSRASTTPDDRSAPPGNYKQVFCLPMFLTV